MRRHHGALQRLDVQRQPADPRRALLFRRRRCLGALQCLLDALGELDAHRRLDFLQIMIMRRRVWRRMNLLLHLKHKNYTTTPVLF